MNTLCANESRVPAVDTVQTAPSEINSVLPMQSSHSASISSDGDLSFSLSVDAELDAIMKNCFIDDELPAFEIRLISPHGRTPSPIDHSSPEDFVTPKKSFVSGNDYIPTSLRHPDFVTLDEINEQISPRVTDKTNISSPSSLETIFEGVFLNTPPRQQQKDNCNQMRISLMEKRALSRHKESHYLPGCDPEATSSKISCKSSLSKAFSEDQEH